MKLNIIYIVQHAILIYVLHIWFFIEIISTGDVFTLQKKAEELHKFTNARIKLTVLELTDRGTPFNYESPNFHSGVLYCTVLCW